MKTWKFIITACLIIVSLSTSAQPSTNLETALRLFDMSLNENKHWKFGYTDCSIVKPEENGFKPILSNKHDMSMESIDGECKVYMSINWSIMTSHPRWGGTADDIYGTYKDIIKEAHTANEPHYQSSIEAMWYLFGKNPYYDSQARKKHSMPIGKYNRLIKNAATFCTKKRAEKLFNANYIMSVPADKILEGKKVQGKYSHLCFVVFGKYESDIQLIFCMTDKGLQNFDKYLDRMKHVFRFNWKG